MSEPLSALRWSGRQAVDSGRATPPPPVRDGNADQLRCSFCQARLGETPVSTIPGSGALGRRTSTSSFCSTYCRDSVLALAALHPSPLASSEFITKRALLTDRLLHLWRHGQGPDPALVLLAARTASNGLASADAV